MTALPSFSGRAPSQMPGELLPFSEFMRTRNCSRYLEIGARHGDTFHLVMSSLDVSTVGVAVDLAGGLWGVSDSKYALRAACDDLVNRGYGVHMILGNSHAPRIIRQCAALAPFDFALIDGDHTYDAVAQDFRDYAPLARYVAFHDIVGHTQSTKKAGARIPVEVPRLWAEIKDGYEHWEFIAPGSQMGIGVIKVRGSGVSP